jgi:hypothetical protein
MSSEKKLIGRGMIMIDSRGNNKHLGYWRGDVPTSLTDWRGRAFKEFKDAENLIQRTHEQNLALYTAGQTGRPPPDTVPDATVRQQLARKDLKKLAEIKTRLGALDSELMAKRQSLKPYDYDNSVAAVMSRQEIRAYLRSMPDDTKRREALRKWQYREAALEALPELSGMSESYHAAITEEQIKFRHGSAVAGLEEAQQALETAYEAVETAGLAATNEVKQAGGQVQEPPAPPPSKPFVE